MGEYELLFSIPARGHYSYELIMWTKNGVDQISWLLSSSIEGIDLKYMTSRLRVIKRPVSINHLWFTHLENVM